MARHRARALLQGYLERVSSDAFDAYQDEIAELIKRCHGIYALYKDDRLYYVGLASNLRGRVRQHLRDKHRDRWNRFSLYLVRRRQHLRELESLLVRIATPKGNRQKGGLGSAKNLKRTLYRLARDAERARRESLLGGVFVRRIRKKSRKKRVTGDREPKRPLLNFFDKAMTITATYKGKTFRARVLSNGWIKLNGKRFQSPSGAAAAVTRGSVDGWYFWKYRHSSGEWRKLDSLRKARV